MPRAQIHWVLLAGDATTSDSAMLLESLKAYTVSKSGLSPCSLCTEPTPHNMRSKQLLCKCTACNSVAPYARCPWKGRVQICVLSDVVNISEAGHHVSPLRPPRRAQLTEEMKTYIREMCAYNHKPMNILTGLVRRFHVGDAVMPSLAKVQRFVQHYRRAHLGGSDFHDDVTAKVREHAIKGDEDLSQPFTFTWRSNADLEPIVGLGSDTDPFVVGVSSRQLLMRLDRDPPSYVLHVDATYKLSQVEYPLLVVGISDCMSSFHPVAFFIMSQQRQSHIAEALSMLRRAYTQLTSKQLHARYVMGDADSAQRHAVNAVLGVDNEVVNLMCYYHLAAKVYEKTRGIPVSLAARVSRDIADMHYATSTAELERFQTRCLEEWQQLPQLFAFANYFSTQWIGSPFCHWQAFLTPRGFAATNNPVEQFNRAIKRDYTLRARLKMGTLIDQLLLCVRTEGIRNKPFATTIRPRADVVRRAREMNKAGSLREVTPVKHSIGFLTGAATVSTTADVVHVVSDPVQRVYDPQDRRTKEALPVSACISAQKARMEIADIPGCGWAVNIDAKTCGCRIFLKAGCCIHLVHGLIVRDRLEGFGRARLVYRGRNRARRQQTENQGAGRPASNGRALQLV